MSLSPEDRATHGRIGAHESWARTVDRAGRTANARKAALDRFEREVDPDGVMDPQTRALAAEHARKAYFMRLGLKSGRARRRAAASPTGDEPDDAAG